MNKKIIGGRSSDDYQQQLTDARRAATWRALERMRQAESARALEKQALHGERSESGELRAQLLREFEEYRARERQGKRWDQVVFSAIVLCVAVGGGLVVGMWVAVLEWWLR